MEPNPQTTIEETLVPTLLRGEDERFVDSALMYLFGDALVHVRIDDLSYEIIPTQGRSGDGIAIDQSSRIWTCGSFAVNR